MPIQMEPLVFAVVLHIQLAEIGVEIVVGEHLAAAVIVDGIAPPLLMVQQDVYKRQVYSSSAAPRKWCRTWAIRSVPSHFRPFR